MVCVSVRLTYTAREFSIHLDKYKSSTNAGFRRIIRHYTPQTHLVLHSTQYITSSSVLLLSPFDPSSRSRSKLLRCCLHCLATPTNFQRLSSRNISFRSTLLRRLLHDYSVSVFLVVSFSIFFASVVVSGFGCGGSGFAERSWNWIILVFLVLGPFFLSLLLFLLDFFALSSESRMSNCNSSISEAAFSVRVVDLLVRAAVRVARADSFFSGALPFFFLLLVRPLH